MAKINWPSLRSYTGEHLQRIALPLGGIGTGTVSLGGRGNLTDWEIMNRPAKGFVPGPRFSGAPFLCLRAQPIGGAAVTRLLEGPVPASEIQGDFGSVASNHGWPRFREARFDTAYPLGQVHLHDLHATILHLLGIDHERLTYPHLGRDYRLTDVYGRVVQEILS